MTTNNKKLENIIKKYQAPDFPTVFKKPKVEKIALEYGIYIGQKILKEFNQEMKNKNFYNEDQLREAFFKKAKPQHPTGGVFTQGEEESILKGLEEDFIEFKETLNKIKKQPSKK